MDRNECLLRNWIQDRLPCIAGAREYKNDRYLIQTIGSPEEMRAAFGLFVEALRQRQTVAGLFVLSEAVSLPRIASGHGQMAQLAQMMALLTQTPPEELANGGKMNFSLSLKCPVTGLPTVFDDFDAVAFCAQSADQFDPLYDPMMATPVPCVNINSDIYAFGMFVRDLALKREMQEVCDLPRAQRNRVFDQAISLWQKYAEQTIAGYVSLTDTTQCPMGLVEGNTRWQAPHQDPAFAETLKEPHLHDMPVLYAPRIVEIWQRRLEGEDVSERFQDITPYGERVSDI